MSSTGAEILLRWMVPEAKECLVVMAREGTAGVDISRDFLLAFRRVVKAREIDIIDF